MQAKQILALALSTALGAGILAAQATSTAPGQSAGRLVRLTPSGQDAEVEPEATLDASAWRQRLGDGDLDLREQAFEEALAAARRDPVLRSELQAWARAEDDAQLAWTSRLLVRELERSRSPWGVQGALDQDPWATGNPGELFERLRQWQGDGQLFQNPGTVSPFQGGGSGSGGAVEQHSQSFQLSVGPDGARCETTVEENGEQVKKTFQADSLEQLLEQNPELRERIRVQRGIDPSQGWLGRFHGLAEPDVHAFGQFRGWQPEPGATALRTDILGVVAHPLSEQEARERGLPAGRQGMVVERVEPGTIADALKIRRGHVLTELNGRKLAARDDISAALAERAGDGEVRLELLDRWGEPRVRVWKPAPETATQAEEEPGLDARELRRL